MHRDVCRQSERRNTVQRDHGGHLPETAATSETKHVRMKRLFQGTHAVLRLFQCCFSAVPGNDMQVPGKRLPLEATLKPHRWATASQNSCQGTVNGVLSGMMSFRVCTTVQVCSTPLESQDERCIHETASGQLSAQDEYCGMIIPGRYSHRRMHLRHVLCCSPSVLCPRLTRCGAHAARECAA
jgi:hypothetical protein